MDGPRDCQNRVSLKEKKKSCINAYMWNLEK